MLDTTAAVVELAGSIEHALFRLRIRQRVPQISTAHNTKPSQLDTRAIKLPRRPSAVFLLPLRSIHPLSISRKSCRAKCLVVLPRRSPALVRNGEAMGAQRRQTE